ncbi:MAG TPA: DUF2752 domain-containing protein [Deltaproteobacteria bacterium]|nr:DUF2752 domain-containing protein [Deltaproteobacteria bacterium]
MNRLLQALDRLAARLARIHPPWWVWPAGLLLAGIFALSASLLLHPGPDEFVYFPNGQRFGDTCAFIVVTGSPCPQCGMTRSWVYAARGQLWTSFLYNPAGLALFGWIMVGALIGAVRLIRRDPEALRPPWQLNVAWAVFWLIGLYAGPWILRLLGINPLPL